MRDCDKHVSRFECAYHPGYAVEIPPGHPFPMGKYPSLRLRLLEEGVLDESMLVEPEMPDTATLALVHQQQYLHKLASHSLSAAEIRRIGIPWSESLWRRSRLAVAGTLLAARNALRDGIAGNLAGGTHHAFADHGEGSCVLNDVAIAIRKLQQEALIERAVVIDLDVHQGNGTAAIFEDDDRVFTFSMHGEKNYPSAKMRSSLDVGLADGIGDGEYLLALNHHLPRVLAARTDLVFYVAGVDVAAGDRFGKLTLSEEGIRARDARVIQATLGLGVPLVIVLGGGYAPTPMRTAALHANVFRAARCYLDRPSGRTCARP